MIRWLPLLAAISGAMAVAAGAFGAHGATGKPAEWLRTGAEYQMVHAAAALAVIALADARLAAWLFVGGGFVFGGTLYAMALGAPKWLGVVTPLGGAALIAGWLALAVTLARG
jgi:uncharacterized membrane protein YgdD (TMEM256/DUF423 family)